MPNTPNMPTPDMPQDMPYFECLRLLTAPFVTTEAYDAAEEFALSCFSSERTREFVRKLPPQARLNALRARLRVKMITGDRA